MDFLQNIWPTIWDWVAANWLIVIGVVAGVYLVNKFSELVIDKLIRRAVKRGKNTTAEAEIKRENTLIRIVHGTLSVLVVILASLMLLSAFGVNIAPLLAAAGVAGLAFGFGGQYLIRDLIAGLFMILENQYRVGDVVGFDGTFGLVEDISLRMTTLRDLSGTVHHVPHGEIKKVSNLTKGYSRVNMDVRVDYAEDLQHVIDLVNKVGRELSEDPKWGPFIIKPPQFFRLEEFAESAMIIRILGDTQPIKQWDVMSELRLRLKLEFDKAGIKFPLPQRVVHKAK